MSKRLKIIILSAVMLVLMIFVYFVIKVNTNARIIVYKDHDINEKFYYKGDEVVVKGLKIYTLDEFRSAFDLEDYAPPYDLPEEKMRVCIVELTTYSKKDDINEEKNDSMDMNNMGLFISDVMLSTKSYANMVEFPLYSLINDGTNMSSSNSGNEPSTLLYPIMLTSPGVRQSVMENIKNEDMWLILTDYEGHEYYDRIKVGGSDVYEKDKYISKVKQSSTPIPTNTPKPTSAPEFHTPKPTPTPPPTQEDLRNMDEENCMLAGIAIGNVIQCNEDVNKYVKDNSITSLKFANLSELVGDPLREAVAKEITNMLQQKKDKGLIVVEFGPPQSEIAKTGEGVYSYEWKYVDGEIVVKYGTNILGDENSDLFYGKNK